MPRTRTFSFVSIPRLEIVDVVLRAGFDGVLIDLEHGAITMHDVPAMVAAADALDGETLVRVSSSHSDSVGKVLDVGVGGIVVPHVGTADAAAEVAAAARFSGERGFNPFVRAGSWGSDPDFASRADANVEVVCMIEGAAGVQHAGEIMRTDGVTGVFLGPYDLSVAFGRPGDTKHPDVVNAISGVVAEAVDVGCSVGVFCGTSADAIHWREQGVDMLFIGTEAGVMMNGYRRILQDLDDA